MLRCRFDIDAEQDPQTASRVLQLVSVRNELPDKFSLKKDGGQLRITLEMLCRDDEESRLLGCKFQNIPTVNQVTRALFPAIGVANVDDSPAPAFWI